MKTYTSTIGERIRQLRNDLSLSIEDLANEAEISPSFLGEIERNTKKPSLQSLEKISTALGISLSELFNYPVESLDSSDSIFLDKILVEVRDCSKAEQEALYRIIKQAIALKNINE